MLFIHNEVVEEILNMGDCIAAQEQAFRRAEENNQELPGTVRRSQEQTAAPMTSQRQPAVTI